MRVIMLKKLVMLNFDYNKTSLTDILIIITYNMPKYIKINLLAILTINFLKIVWKNSLVNGIVCSASKKL